MTMLFPRPVERELAVNRETLPGKRCPRCSGANIARYPVLSVGGWEIVERCQDCLEKLRTSPPPSPYGLNYRPYSTLL